MESRSIDLISKKKNKLHVQHTFFSNQQKKQICTCSTLFVFLCHCFAQLQRCFVGLKRQTSWLHMIFIEELSYVLTQFCLLCSCSLLFFTAAHFHLAGRLWWSLAFVIREISFLIREKISCGLLQPRTPSINGTKSMFMAYSTQGQLKPRLILAEGFWDGLIQAAAYLGRESVRINALKRCPRLAEAVNDCCACSVFNYIPDLHGRETRVAVAGK